MSVFDSLMRSIEKDREEMFRLGRSVTARTAAAFGEWPPKGGWVLWTTDPVIHHDTNLTLPPVTNDPAVRVP